MLGSPKGIAVFSIPTLLFSILRKLPTWHETKLAATDRISLHYHKYAAVYFIQGIRRLELRGDTVALPRCAIAVFKRDTAHGWQQVDPAATVGFVGHFHRNHQPHRVIA